MAETFANRFAQTRSLSGPLVWGLDPSGAHMHPDLELSAVNALSVAPGVGGQGATPSDVAQVFHSCRDRVMPSASRLLLEAGPEVSKLRSEIQGLAAVFKDLLA